MKKRTLIVAKHCARDVAVILAILSVLFGVVNAGFATLAIAVMFAIEAAIRYRNSDAFGFKKYLANIVLLLFISIALFGIIK